VSRSHRACWAGGFGSVLIGMALGAVPVWVSAQTVYRCQDAAGKTVMSDRPCDTSTKPAGIVATQPALGPRWNGPSRPAGAPEYYDYLGGACRSLNDAMRGAGRSNNYQALHSLQEEWRQRCAEDESEAYRAYYEKRQLERNERTATRMAEAAERQQARVAKQQCNDMAQILAAKRARGDLNDVERAELQRFADNHRARCLQ
jgi:Domain of unknown function (DUF4124)